MHSITPANELHQHVQGFLLGKLIRDVASKILLGVITVASLLSIYQNSKLPEGKQVLSINHFVCTNSSGAMSHSSFME